MEHKIFLKKYRVSVKEIEEAGEVGERPVAYEGEELESGNKVVVELFPAASLKPAVREQLEAEALAAKKLAHVNIPALYDFGVEDDHLVYVSEDFEGTPAEDWVKTHGPMPVGAVLRIASQVVGALGAAAVQRISHHAINPANLVLVPGQTAEGEWPLVKVLHFVGVAPKFSSGDVAVAAFDKSAPYASPEQLRDGTVDFRSEIYSLGCTMWFLLIGAPPLPAAIGPVAVPSPNVAEKLSGVPKAVRRLLTQMLSANPGDRPNDPLAFYRQIQSCLVQVERRGTLARRFGIPAISTTPTATLPMRRPIPRTALALAAILLAIATLSAVILPGFLRHRRVVRAEEPLGVPIGVPDAAASAPPPNATNAVSPNPPQTNTTVANANSNEPAPVRSSEENNTPPPVANDAGKIASANPIAPAPLTTNPTNVQPEQQTPVVTNNSATVPAETDSSAIASANQVGPAPKQAESSNAEPAAVSEKPAPKKIVRHEVRRAEPAEPEVRRAEPAPPEEGPVDTAANTTVASEQQTNSVAQPAESRNTEAEPSTTSSESVKRTEAAPKVTARAPAKKTEREAKSKRKAEGDFYVERTAPESEEGMRPLPRGSVRARFVGVTADGRWMLALPSHKVIVVPPPSEP
ncbi:MAG: eukaryotic-like serine/threonine-protein kinase [Verrucomicrobiota bacterium]|jgi:serine/threonine-protein kinase